ncbi:MAG TPA: hypothetical protein VI461_00515 [Chitinophagaceae bacterium]|nr:hypothetical protein [Chitinophagaceae bacterium]
MRTHLPCVRFIVLSLLLTFSFQSHSQSITTNNGKFEIGLGFGPMFFLGDLGGSKGVGKRFIKDLDFPLTNISKNLYAVYYPSEWLGFRIAINHGLLEGDDAQAPNKGGAEVDRLERNLSFKTSVLEGYLAAEIYPTYFFEQYDGLKGKFRPYGLAGIGIMKYNPKAELDGQWVALKPLRLEGQGMAEYPDRKEYSLVQKEIPIGIGFKYYLTEGMYVGLEVLHRQLFTDYIDDVSTGYIDRDLFDVYLTPTDAAKAKRLYYRGTYQGSPGQQQRPDEVMTYQRGDPTENDAFFSTIFRFGWRLGGEHSGELRKLRCPVFY